MQFDGDAFVPGFLEVVSDPVFVVDTGGELRWWNDRFREVTGYDDDELAGLAVFDLLPADQRPRFREWLAGVESGTAADTLEGDLLAKDGERVRRGFDGTRIESDSEAWGAVGVARDAGDGTAAGRWPGRQRDELSTLVSVNEAIYDAIRALTESATREGIEAAVCERLRESELYTAVWVGRNTGEGLELTVAEAEPEFLDAIGDLDDEDWERPAERALRSAEIQVSRNHESDAPERAHDIAEEWGIEAGAAVPLVYRDTTYGVLAVHSRRPDAFNERERMAFRRLGEIAGFAINAVLTERLLLSDTATELQFRSQDTDGLLTALSEHADGPCRHRWTTPLEEGRFRHYVTVEGLDPDRVLEVAGETPSVRSCRHLGPEGESHVFEVITSDSMVRRLVELGASPESIVAEDGEANVVVSVPSGIDPNSVVAAAKDVYDTEMVAKRDVDRPVRPAEGFEEAVSERLTDRQATVLRHAYYGGYFEWPREATAEELAETLSISSATFHYHIRQAEAVLVQLYLEHLEG